MSDVIKHYGVKGMKWRVKRGKRKKSGETKIDVTNRTGSYTAPGIKGKVETKKSTYIANKVNSVPGLIKNRKVKDLVSMFKESRGNVGISRAGEKVYNTVPKASKEYWEELKSNERYKKAFRNNKNK